MVFTFAQVVESLAYLAAPYIAARVGNVKGTVIIRAFGAFFTATSMIGMIALAGIMVRNGILLIDYLEARRAAGIPLEQAIIEAGAVRTRPIVLTAGTVVIGAIVILFDPIFEGLAVSLITGAIASTILTLIVVPSIYYLVHRKPKEVEVEVAVSNMEPKPETS